MLQFAFVLMTLKQGIEMSIMLLVGVGLALLLDAYRALRSLWRPGQLGTVVGDIAFSVVASLLIAVVLVLTTWGEWRLYYLLFMAVGFVLYRLLAGYRIVVALRGLLRWVFGVVDSILIGVAKILAILGRVIAFPAALAYQVITFLGRVVSTVIVKPIELLRKH